MTRTPFVVAATLSLLAGCASAPLAETAAGTAALDCAALDAQIGLARDAQRSAAQKQQDAWKSVLPIAAVARFGQGAVEVTQSQQRLDDLQNRAMQQGCRGPGVVVGGRGEGLSTTAQGQGLRARSFN